MAYEFKLPDLGEGLTEGEIARWLVAEGDEIAEDDPLVEIADRQDDGRDPLAGRGQGRADPRRGGRGRAGRDGARRDRRRRRRSRVDAAGAAGRPDESSPRSSRAAAAGASGDPARAQDRAGAGGRPRDGRAAPARAAGSPRRTSAAPRRSPGTRPAGGGTPRAAARRAAADRRAHDARAPRGAAGHLRRGVRLQRASTCARLVPTVLQAVARSRCSEFPELNARLEGDEIVYLDRYDLGSPSRPTRGSSSRSCAAATRARSTSSRAEVARLAEGARAGTLAPEELRGSTFTRHERRQARRPLRDAARQPPRGRRSSASTGSRRGRSCATARSSSARSGTCRSRSTTAWSTARARAEFALAVIARLERPGC